MARSFAVFAMAFAGLFVLAGAGWALLAGAFLVLVLWRREPDWRAVGSRVAAAGSTVAARVKAAPRRATALTGMTSGIMLVPVGLGLSASLGVGLAACGVLLIGVGLLTGWGA
jgi:hypothetical protein